MELVEVVEALVAVAVAALRPLLLLPSVPKFLTGVSAVDKHGQAEPSVLLLTLARLPTHVSYQPMTLDFLLNISVDYSQCL